MKPSLRVLVLGVLAMVVTVTPVIPAASYPEDGDAHGWTDYDSSDGPAEVHQHGGVGGHLPASSEKVNSVGKLRLTNVRGGIADVGYYKGFAYLNAFSPECAGRPGAQGTGVHVVDVSDPANPAKVEFLPAHPNSYVGEGISVMTVDTPFFQGDILVHNNETCDSNQFTPSGVSIWDVTDPLNPVFLAQGGDPSPAVANQTFHSIHSVQGFTQPGRAFAVLVDNQETDDVDILEITDPTAPVVIAEVGLEDWPGAQASFANGDTVFHHDLQFKRIGGHDFLLVSYWDAGQVLLNVDDPSNPVFVGDSDFLSPDPLTGFEISEGNSHESYWSSNNKYVLSSDEDFSPTRTLCEILTGPNAGATGCGEFGFSVPLTTQFPTGFSGSTVFGGSGCEEDVNGNGTSDRAEVPSQSSTGADAVVFVRGTCFFSKKIESGELAGYNLVIIGQSHVGSRNGLLPDAFICGGQGSPVLGLASSICIGHRATHQLFNDAESFTGPDNGPGGDSPAIGTLGEGISAEGGIFDAWGYVNLHDATDPNLPIIGAYAVAEALDPAFKSGFGTLSVHEVKTDPRRGINLAYLSYYNAGFRVVEFGANGIQEVGHFIDEGGNNFWGVFPVGDELAGHGYAGQHPGIGNGVRPLILLSDRDFGLYIVDYTGKKPKKD